MDPAERDKEDIVTGRQRAALPDVYVGNLSTIIAIMAMDPAELPRNNEAIISRQLQRDHLDNGQVINREPIPLGDHKDQQRAERLERSLAKCQGTNKGQRGQTR